VDETYINVKGKWCYLYRAIDRDGNLVDSMVSEKRAREAVKRFDLRKPSMSLVRCAKSLPRISLKVAGVPSSVNSSSHSCVVTMILAHHSL
jgi:hypothetical protein